MDVIFLVTEDHGNGYQGSGWNLRMEQRMARGALSDITYYLSIYISITAQMLFVPVVPLVTEHWVWENSDGMYLLSHQALSVSLILWPVTHWIRKHHFRPWDSRFWSALLARIISVCLDLGTPWDQDPLWQTSCDAQITCPKTLWIIYRVNTPPGSLGIINPSNWSIQILHQLLYID